MAVEMAVLPTLSPELHSRLIHGCANARDFLKAIGFSGTGLVKFFDEDHDAELRFFAKVRFFFFFFFFFPFCFGAMFLIR